MNAPARSETAKLLEQAAKEIQRLRARASQLEAPSHEPIAIVGMGCRFPGGANSPELFWERFAGGAALVSKTPPSRWSSEYWDPVPGKPGKTYCNAGGYLDEIDTFDAV